MSFDRIYCSEQIVIPPDLPQIVKEYAKAVIHEQPTDILLFSSKYFTKLAAVCEGNAEPSRFLPDQKTIVSLKLALEKLEESSFLNEDTIMKACVANAVPRSSAHGVLRLHRMTRQDSAIPDSTEFCLLLMALGHPSLPAVVAAAFAGLGMSGRLPGSRFLRLLRILNKYDPSVSPQVLLTAERWVGSLVQTEGEDPQVSYRQLEDAGVLPK
eukprot:gnl/Dysnectes_brevis/4925_a6852_516.p1 GENE.gnl/Dysnectes_brevis/4925_a6852_516~~gnl/Dysnectes_brevis/4925_a6852_516.p1  ORF type:complete len:212 (+),score=55.67 gnl/Dysnectes_brevis/4925_a6852_516:111-746(+)